MKKYKCTTSIIVEANNEEEANEILVDKLNDDYSLELYVEIEELDSL